MVLSRLNSNLIKVLRKRPLPTLPEDLSLHELGSYVDCKPTYHRYCTEVHYWHLRGASILKMWREMWRSLIRSGISWRRPC